MARTSFYVSLNFSHEWKVILISKRYLLGRNTRRSLIDEQVFFIVPGITDCSCYIDEKFLVLSVKPILRMF